MYKVCIIGNDGAGKSTLAKLIQTTVLTDAEVCSFASTLKADLASINVPVHKKPYSASIRNFVRSYGDLMRELYGPGYWADKLISSLNDTSHSIVVDDMRYWSELEAWTTHFGKSTKVITVGAIQPYKDDYARSVIEVNELLTVLRKDATSNTLHLPDIKTTPQEITVDLLKNYLISNNK